MAFGSNKVLNKPQTLDYLYNKFINNERLIVSRYNDGEYLLMNGQDTKLLGSGCSKVLKDLLNESVKNNKQFICTAYIGSTEDVPEKNIWYKTQKYILDNTNADLYGCSSWLMWDFCGINKLLPKLFSGHTLVLTGLTEFFKPSVESYNKNLVCYQTPLKHSEKHYQQIKDDVISICKNFKNIIFACGPVGKVILVDLINECDSNLVDVGCLVNAICHQENKWTMSWAQSRNIDPYIRDFKFQMSH